MNQPIAKWFIEVVCAAFFAVAVIFTFRLYTSSGNNPSTTNSYAREGTAVSEVTDEQHQQEVDAIIAKGNEVSGSSIYYDLVQNEIPTYITNNGKAEATITVGSTVVNNMIKEAKEGSPENLMAAINKSATYLKTYTYQNKSDGTTETTSITYTVK